MLKTTTMIQQWKSALTAEIQKLKEYEGRGIPILRGKHLANNEKGAVYWLILAYPGSVFQGGAILFEYRGKRYEGSVLSSEGTDVIVELDTDLGDETGRGTLFNEPWDLLNKLMDRLEEIEEDPVKLSKVEKVMSPGGNSFHPREKVQSLIHEAVLRSKYNPVTYIWGPPGTGKTYNLARTAAYQYVNGQKVLLLSHSNAAVDVLILEMSRFLQENNKWVPGEVIRYGFPEKEEVLSHPDLSVVRLAETQDADIGEKKRKFEKKRFILKKKLTKKFTSMDSAQLTKVEVGLAKLREKLRKNENTFVNEAEVVATTLSKAATDPLIYQNQFDLVIIDEASMAFSPQIAFAATLGKRAVICGDFRQLPPIAVSRHKMTEKWLKQDIFHLSGITDRVERGESHPQLMLLPVQRRMHPDISAFTNKEFYHSLVSDHPDVLPQRETITGLAPFEDEAAVLLSVSDSLAWCQTDGGSRWNLLSSLVSIQLMLSANHSGMSSIGFVTPYRAQAKWMNSILPFFFNARDLTIHCEIMAATVHKFQGSEKDMVIFDSTDSSPHEKAGTLLAKKESGRLINVSVTRAKGKFILVSDDSFVKQHLSAEKPIRKLISYLEEKTLRQSKNMDTLLNPVFTKRLRWYHKENTDKLIRDICFAKDEVILSFEKPEDLPNSVWETLANNQSKKNIIVLCKQSAGIPLQHYQKQEAHFIQPYIGLDKKVLWFGADRNYKERKTFPYMARVFSGKFFSAYVSFFNSIRAHAWNLKVRVESRRLQKNLGCNTMKKTNKGG
ncbi:AAA domain-containing protein [Bacillus sp. AK031]